MKHFKLCSSPIRCNILFLASGSVNNSTNNSRRNSLDLKKPSVTIIMEVEDGNLGDQKKPIEDCKNNIDSAMVTSTPQKPFIANGYLKVCRTPVLVILIFVSRPFMVNFTYLQL